MSDPVGNGVGDQWWAGLGLRPVRDGGALKGLMGELLDWLVTQGYARTTIHNIVRAALRLGEWMARDGLNLSDLGPESVADLVRADNAAHPSHRVSNESASAVGRFLQSTGRLAVAGHVPEPVSVARSCLEAWCASLVDAGYGRSWIDKARTWVGPFLDLLDDGDGVLDWQRVDAQLTNDYVLNFSARYSSSSSQCLAALLRALLSWAATEGLTAHQNCEAVLSVRRTPSRLPMGIPADQVKRLRESIDTSLPPGKRDLAIIVLLARLGLRVGEVAGLTLEHIDWHQPSLQVVGKGNRRLVLPMPVDVGESLVDYLRVRRAEPGERHVFVRCLAPLRAMSSTAVSNVVSTRAKTAGFEGIYAHRLRHTAAVGVLAGGGDLETVRQLLGHAAAASSLSYARLDYEPLRQLAPVWGQLP